MGCSPRCYDLRTQISVLRAVGTEDNLGGRSKVWSLLEQPWAEIKASGMSEGPFADGRNTNSTLKLTVRYTDITEKDKIQLDGVDYAIVSVQDPDMRKRWLELRIVKGIAP